MGNIYGAAQCAEVRSFRGSGGMHPQENLGPPRSHLPGFQAKYCVAKNNTNLQYSGSVLVAIQLSRKPLFDRVLTLSNCSVKKM